MNRGKILLLALVFVGAVGFFFWALSKMLYPTSAAGDQIKIAFEKNAITAKPNELIPVNVFFQLLPDGSDNKVSAGKVSLRYSPTSLVFDESQKDAVDATCTGADFSLKTLFALDHDTKKGIIAMSRVAVDPDEANLPPHSDTGISCFATFYFKVRAGGVGSAFSPGGRVVFLTGSNDCEFVGPNKNYTCAFDKTRSTVLIKSTRVSPTNGGGDPTTGKECGRCGGFAGFECSAGLECKSDPNVQDSFGVCVKSDGSSVCKDTSGSASISFRPQDVNVSPSEKFSVDVLVDAAGHNIYGVDARLQFDADKLEVESIKDGNFLEVPFKRFINANSVVPKCIENLAELDESDLNNDGEINAVDYGRALEEDKDSIVLSKILGAFNDKCDVSGLNKPGNIYIVGVVGDRLPIKGRGVLATINFKPRVAGQSKLGVVCTPNKIISDSNIINDKITDVIDCNANGQTDISVSSGGQNCSRRVEGDCNCDGLVDIADFEPWRKEKTGELKSLKCDYNGNKIVGLDDFNIWRTNYFIKSRPTPIVIDDPIESTLTPKVEQQQDEDEIVISPTKTPTLVPTEVVED